MVVKPESVVYKIIDLNIRRYILKRSLIIRHKDI